MNAFRPSQEIVRIKKALCLCCYDLFDVDDLFYIGGGDYLCNSCIHDEKGAFSKGEWE